MTRLSGQQEPQVVLTSVIKINEEVSLAIKHSMKSQRIRKEHSVIIQTCQKWVLGKCDELQAGTHHMSHKMVMVAAVKMLFNR